MRALPLISLSLSVFITAYVTHLLLLLLLSLSLSLSLQLNFSPNQSPPQTAYFRLLSLMANQNQRPLLAFLAFLSFILSFQSIIFGGLVGTRSTIYCIPHFAWWFLVMGLFLALLSIVGMIASYWGYQKTLISYLGIKVALVAFMLAVLGIAFTTINNVGLLSVGDPDKWEVAVKCLYAASVCQEQHKYEDCCQQPAICGSVTNVVLADCNLWSLELDQLCYYCSACQYKVLAIFTSEWSSINGALLITSVVLVVIVFVLEMVFFVFGWDRLLQLFPQSAQQDQE